MLAETVITLIVSSTLILPFDGDLDDITPRQPISQKTGAQATSDAVAVFGDLDFGAEPHVSDGRYDGAADPTADFTRGCETLNVAPRACDTVERDVPGEPAVTLSDLAIFRPATPNLTGDPVGYSLMNAPANIIATAEEQTVTGELFDRPVQVRFVPVAYTFDYGDGASRTSDTGGATWEALGVPQFTPTATTHAYGERGTYSVGVTVAYAPFVDFGSGWRPVPGTVSATTAGYDIQIVEARTALVARDCLEDPSGVGCPTR